MNISVRVLVSASVVSPKPAQKPRKLSSSPHRHAAAPRALRAPNAQLRRGDASPLRPQNADGPIAAPPAGLLCRGPAPDGHTSVAPPCDVTVGHVAACRGIRSGRRRDLTQTSRNGENFAGTSVMKLKARRRPAERLLLEVSDLSVLLLRWSTPTRRDVMATTMIELVQTGGAGGGGRLVTPCGGKF